jgi:putative ABC transport system permease protein
MLWRDARAGELRLLMLGLMIAVAAITSVGFLADRVGRALERDTSQMLGADLKIDSDNVPSPDYVQAAQARGLSAITIVQFPSMASVGEAAQLVALKAVPNGYPLRGTLRSVDQPVGGTPQEGGMPAPGTVWVDAQLLSMLNIRIGDAVRLGDIALKVARIITYEPDRSLQFVNVAPRALINSADLPATKLLGPGARLDYHLLVAGSPEGIANYISWVTPRLAQGERLDTLATARPEVRHALDRAQRFLALVALLAVLISAVAVALSARRFMLRHRNGIAVMRCLGASQAQITRMLLAEFAVIGLIVSAVGAAIGLGMHSLLIQALDGLIDTELPAPRLVSAFQGVTVGLWLLFVCHACRSPSAQRAACQRVAPRRLAPGPAQPGGLCYRSDWLCRHYLVGCWRPPAGGNSGCWFSGGLRVVRVGGMGMSGAARPRVVKARRCARAAVCTGRAGAPSSSDADTVVRLGRRVNGPAFADNDPH